MIQAEKIIPIIETGADGRYRCYDPETGLCCLVGSLLKAAGVPVDDLDSFDKEDLLQREYGLDPQAVDDLMMVNDHYIIIRDRRQALINQVRMLVAEERA